MPFDLNSLRSSRETRPPCTLIYGVPGVGKTTFGCSALAPILLPTEDGAGLIDVPAFPLAKTYADVVEALLPI